MICLAWASGKNISRFILFTLNGSGECSEIIEEISCQCALNCITVLMCSQFLRVQPTRASLNQIPSTTMKATSTPKILGRDWSEIQAMQQGKSTAKHLPPVDLEKMKVAILSDVERFKASVAVEVVDKLGIELPASYKLIGDTWTHSPSPAESAPEGVSVQSGGVPASPVDSVGVPAVSVDLPRLKVMADREFAGLHPCHDSRFIATEDAMEDPDRPNVLESGSLICAMRDLYNQKEVAAEIVNRCNAFPGLLLFVQRLADGGHGASAQTVACAREVLGLPSA